MVSCNNYGLLIKFILCFICFAEFPSGGRDQQLVSHARHSPFVDIDPQATRSLFVGNIPKNISIYELRDMFQRFGNVLVSIIYIVCHVWTICVYTVHVHVHIHTVGGFCAQISFLDVCTTHW